jgi:hypothetical protein
MKRIFTILITIIMLPGSISYSQDYQQIKNIISNVNADSLMENLSILSGAKSFILSGQNTLITSRYRGSKGNIAAASFLKNKLSTYKTLKVSEQPLPDSGKNIIAVQTGLLNPQRKIIICCHYDSHLSGINSPGADDNGTGTAAVLEAAKILSSYSSLNTIIYAFFDREEEDLNGSEYFASQSSVNKDSIIAVINLDMLGWDKNGQSDVEIDSKPTITLSAQLAKDVKDVNDKCNIGLYITLVSIAKSNADNDSFWKYNFPAILLIELYGYENPYMHKTTDVVQNINKPFFEKCVKLGIASVIRYTNLAVTDGATDVKSNVMIPVEYSLEQNFPNPFNPSTIITYSIPKAEHVSLKIYDIMGREVATLVNEFKQSGVYNSQFSILNYQLSSGVYFYRMQTGNFVTTKKLVLLK